MRITELKWLVIDEHVDTVTQTPLVDPGIIAIEKQYPKFTDKKPITQIYYLLIKQHRLRDI